MMMKTQRLINRLPIFGEQLILATIGIATLFATGQEILLMVNNMSVKLADLFLLFIYAEVLGMVGAFYVSHRIPVTLPIIIAMTALCRLIVLHSKEMDPYMLVAEAVAVVVLAGAAYIMSLKDKISLEKIEMRKKYEDSPDN